MATSTPTRPRARLEFHGHAIVARMTTMDIVVSFSPKDNWEPGIYTDASVWPNDGSGRGWRRWDIAHHVRDLLEQGAENRALLHYFRKVERQWPEWLATGDEGA